VQYGKLLEAFDNGGWIWKVLKAESSLGKPFTFMYVIGHPTVSIGPRKVVVLLIVVGAVTRQFFTGGGEMECGQGKSLQLSRHGIGVEMRVILHPTIGLGLWGLVIFLDGGPGRWREV